jgi:mannosyltransferase OCH1-like enzyme
MRSRLILLIILFILLTLGFAISRLVAIIQLFFEHSGVAITPQEIASVYAELGAQRRPQLIPKIIHQVFHDWRHQNWSLPSDWDDLRQTCINLHEDWEYVVCRNLLSIIA